MQTAAKQVITKKYNGRFFNVYVEITCFTQEKQVKQRKHYGCYK